MSDYPRPAAPVPARPFPFDRIVAMVFAPLVLLAMVIWLVNLLRRPDALTMLGPWRWYFVSGVASMALYAWVFFNYARSRFWALMTALFLAALSILSHALSHQATQAAIGFVLLAYSVARLFGMLGPKPLRRVDLLPG